MGRLVSEYVPLGVASKHGVQSRRDISSTAKIAPKGVGSVAAQYMAPASPSPTATETSSVETLGANFFTGMLLASLAAACGAFAVTMHGLGVPPAVSTVDVAVQAGQELIAPAIQTIQALVPDTSSATSDNAAVEVAKAVSAISSVASVAVAAATQSKKTTVASAPISHKSSTATTMESDRMRRLTMQWKKEDEISSISMANRVNKEVEKSHALLAEAQKRQVTRTVVRMAPTDQRAAMRMFLITKR